MWHKYQITTNISRNFRRKNGMPTKQILPFGI